MEKLISSKQNLVQVPDSYIFPPERRPGKLEFASCQHIPVIDLHDSAGGNQKELVKQIMTAGQEFGFFQLTSHGIPEELMKGVVEVAEEFFQLPAEEKASFYSEDQKKKCRLFTSIDYKHEDVHFWRDCFRHSFHPLEDHVNVWPTNPSRYREVMEKYSIHLKELTLRLLDLISEGLGLAPGYFEGEFSGNKVMILNYYPPCPDPSLTLGLPKHSDPNLITLLNQGLVPGLQVLKDEEWLAIEPIPNSIVVNIGYALQIISNGKLKSVDHRAVTNTQVPRTTVASFIHPSPDCKIEPAMALVDQQSPPLYKSFLYRDFAMKYIEATHSGKDPLKQYEISMPNVHG